MFNRIIYLKATKYFCVSVTRNDKIVFPVIKVHWQFKKNNAI